MARIGGRNNWLAVPAGLLCVAIVAGLVYLAVPMVPVSLAWAGDTLRTATAPRPEAPARPTPAQSAAVGMIDCRDLYPDSLWSELTWKGGVLLSQSAAPPATAVTSLMDALVPTVRVTCDWRLRQGGRIVTTLAAVAADAGALVHAALRGQGYICAADDAAVSCRRERGDVIEEHAVRGGLWLSSVETRWHPDEYGARVEAYVWGTGTG